MLNFKFYGVFVMHRHLKTFFILFLLTFSTMCIGKETTPQSSTPVHTVAEENAYEGWLKNETKYFAIYYPPVKAEGFNFNIRFLLVGIDYVYESYAKAFGKAPEKIELYIYPSEDDLKFDYSTDLPWYIEGNKIFTFIEKDAKSLDYYNVESALIAYLTGKVNGLTFVFPLLGELYFRGADYSGLSFDELLSLVDSRDVSKIKEQEGSMVDFVAFLVHKYGVNEVLRLLETDTPSKIIKSLPNAEEEYNEFIRWFWGGGILEGSSELEEMNLTVSVDEESAFFLANGSFKVKYTKEYYPVFFKMVYLDLKAMNTQYLQSFTFLLPYERKNVYELSYIGNFSVQPLTYDENINYFLSGMFMTPNLTLLFDYYLFPKPAAQQLPKGGIKVVSKNTPITTTLPSQAVFLVTGRFKTFKGFVNGTEVEFYYTNDVESPATVFKQSLSAFNTALEWFELPSSKFRIVYTRGPIKEHIYRSRDLLIYKPKSGYHELYFLWGLYYSWLNSFKIKPKDAWVPNSLFSLLEGVELKRLEDYRKSALYRYKVNLRDFPEVGYPLIEGYRYFYSDKSWMKNSMVYKGFLTFYLLYTQAGEEAFKDALREFSREVIFKEADFDDFAELLAKKSGDEKVLLIWKTWTTKPALPNLTVQNVEIVKTNDNYTVKFTLVDKNGFAFPFKIGAIGWQGQRTEVEGFYYGEPQKVEISLPGEPKEIVIYGAPFLSKNFDVEANGTKISVTVSGS